MGFLKSDTALPPYLPFPWFLLTARLSDTARLLYCLLLNRARLSISNNWLDGEGNVYVVYPVSELAGTLGRGETVVRTGLKQLETQGLIKRCHVKNGKASHILIGIPPSENRKEPQRNSGAPPSGKTLPSKNYVSKNKKVIGTPLAGRTYDCEEDESL